MGKNAVHKMNKMNKKRAQADKDITWMIMMLVHYIVLMLVLLKMGLVVTMSMQEKEINDAKVKQNQSRSKVSG